MCSFKGCCPGNLAATGSSELTSTGKLVSCSLYLVSCIQLHLIRVMRQRQGQRAFIECKKLASFCQLLSRKIASRHNTNSQTARYRDSKRQRQKEREIGIQKVRLKVSTCHMTSEMCTKLLVLAAAKTLVGFMRTYYIQLYTYLYINIQTLELLCTLEVCPVDMQQMQMQRLTVIFQINISQFVAFRQIYKFVAYFLAKYICRPQNGAYT